jgi:hypothetical protein
MPLLVARERWTWDRRANKGWRVGPAAIAFTTGKGFPFGRAYFPDMLSPVWVVGAKDVDRILRQPNWRPFNRSPFFSSLGS